MEQFLGFFLTGKALILWPFLFMVQYLLVKIEILKMRTEFIARAEWEKIWRDSMGQIKELLKSEVENLKELFDAQYGHK